MDFLMSIGLSTTKASSTGKAYSTSVSAPHTEQKTPQASTKWTIPQVAALTAAEIVELPADEQSAAIQVVAERLPLDSEQIAGFDRATRRRYVFLARRCCQNLVSPPALQTH